MDTLAKTRRYFAVSNQIGLLHVLDARMTLHNHYGGILCFSSVVFFLYKGVLGNKSRPSGEILSICETPEWLHG